MNSNQELVSHLIRSGILQGHELINAFLKCDRALFVPQNSIQNAYEDYPLPIGEGQTISQPTTVALMLRMLDVHPGDHILDIGSGSGWTTALLASLTGAEGNVMGLEIIPALVELGKENLKKLSFSNASIQTADHSTLGIKGDIFDRILVSASAHKLPAELFDQLKSGGILVIPIGNSIFKFIKNDDGTLSQIEYPGFVFVPLIH